ncbi:hypothetical protein KGQ20_42430, partial [Catenulispora sp. NF23]
TTADVPAPALPASASASASAPASARGSAAPWVEIVAAAPPPVQEAPSEGVRIQPVPEPAASAVPSARDIAKERIWLRRSLTRQFDAAVNSVARVVSEVPGLRGAGSVSPEELISDLVAVRLYLGGDTRGLDDMVRGATVGAHVPLARCVAAGLRHLPSHRGAVRMAADLTPPQLAWYRDRDLLTEWAFAPALSTAGLALPGQTEIHLWSVTGRRTALIDPAVEGQVVFLPGTRFRVLDAGAGRLLLREVSASEGGSEVASEGRLGTASEQLDDLARQGLEQAARSWHDAGLGTAAPPGNLLDRFSSPPGLIGTRDSGPARRTTWSSRPGDPAAPHDRTPHDRTPHDRTPHSRTPHDRTPPDDGDEVS